MEIILAIATILGGITALWFFWEKYSEARKSVYKGSEAKDTATIKLYAPQLISNKQLSFGMLHVRDGKDQIPDHGPLLNKEILPIANDSNLVFTTEYTKHLGFQFKLYVDYRGINYEEIRALLENTNVTSVSQGGGKSARAWFILPKYEVCTTNDGFTNNYYYPA